MSGTPIRDLLVGFFVLLGMVAVGYLSIQVGGVGYGGPGGLILHASFDEIGGLNLRGPVVVGGVKVGTIRAIELDPKSFRADVTMEVDAKLALPKDTSASILTQGVLGDQYVALEPGGDEELLRNGDRLALTQSAVVLERLIGKLVSNIGSGDGS